MVRRRPGLEVSLLLGRAHVLLALHALVGCRVDVVANLAGPVAGFGRGGLSRPHGDVSVAGEVIDRPRGREGRCLSTMGARNRVALDLLAQALGAVGVRTREKTGAVISIVEELEAEGALLPLAGHGGVVCAACILGVDKSRK